MKPGSLPKLGEIRVGTSQCLSAQAEIGKLPLPDRAAMEDYIDQTITLVGSRGNPNSAPGMLKIGVVGAPLLPGGDPRIFATPGETREEANGGRCERKDPRSRLRVGEVELTRLEVGVFPPQRLDFGEPAACQHEETDRGHRRSSLRAILVTRVKARAGVGRIRAGSGTDRAPPPSSLRRADAGSSRRGAGPKAARG